MSWAIAVPTVVLEEVQVWTVSPRGTIVLIVLSLSPLKTFGVQVQPSWEYMSAFHDGDE